MAIDRIGKSVGYTLILQRIQTTGQMYLFLPSFAGCGGQVAL